MLFNEKFVIFNLFYRWCSLSLLFFYMRQQTSLVADQNIQSTFLIANSYGAMIKNALNNGTFIYSDSAISL